MSGSKEQATSMAMSQTMNSALVTPAEIQWGPAPDVLPAGIQGAVLYGDPTKDGLFSMRFKRSKVYHVPPHTLSKAGTFTVMTGVFPYRDGCEIRSDQVESHAGGKLHRASARHPALRVRGRGDGGSAQQYRALGAHLHRSEGRPGQKPK